MKSYGYFDDERREYVITDPRTPVKWINYIGTLAFGGFVDQTGGALLCRGDPALNRITRYLTLLPAADFRGETLYLRLHESGGYKIFSPFFTPTLDAFERYECRVGLGYTRIVSEFYGVRTEVTIFVPPGAFCEVRDLRVTNLRPAPLRIDAVPVVEYSHFDALKQLTNADWVPQTVQSRAFREPDGQVALIQYAFMHRERQINFFTASHPASSFETDRRRFLGQNEYGSWRLPQALLEPELGCGEALRGDNLGALLLPLDELAPGETARRITLLGQAESLEAARAIWEQYCTGPAVDGALAALAGGWEARLERLQVCTPDPDADRMLNLHNPRQCYITLQWSRYLSLYQLGYGSRGIGVRDSAQDVMGVLALAPEEGKDLLCKLLSVQRRDGSSLHQFNPLTMVGEIGDAADNPDAPHYYSDDHLWPALAVCAYLKETGDLAFLDEEIAFYEQDRTGRPLETGTVLEHLRRALAFTAGDLGAHGLPKLGYADWNDTVNLRAGAESLFSACLYGRALLELAELLEFLNRPAEAAPYRAGYEAMRARVNECAWESGAWESGAWESGGADGGWYMRYFDWDGTPLGSRTNEHGQIYANGQSWPVIAGFAPPERARQALDAVHRRLNTRCGIKLSAPGFDGYDPARGGITTYPPGAKENGGIFLHANPWVMIAECLLGNGERAYEYYRQINPAGKNEHIDEYECEPYVYAQNILGDEHPQFGLARNSWLTGTASWVYQAATQHILGLQPTYRGLRIDPCLPPAWDGFSASRLYRGARYEIAVHNPDHTSRGVGRLTVDGREMAGNVLPIFADGGRHEVEIWLG